MNSFLTFVVIGVVAIFGATSAQEGSCGCAPQPTVIQLSCGGGQPNIGPSQPPPPPPPPAYNPAPPAWSGAAPQEETLSEDLMHMCEFDSNGYPTSHPPGGFPEGFHIATDSHGMPHPIASAEYPLPPVHWDGRMETLGFPMPQPGTPHYNMLLCSPIPVVTAGK